MVLRSTEDRNSDRTVRVGLRIAKFAAVVLRKVHRCSALDESNGYMES